MPSILSLISLSLTLALDNLTFFRSIEDNVLPSHSFFPLLQATTPLQYGAMPRSRTRSQSEQCSFAEQQESAREPAAVIKTSIAPVEALQGHCVPGMIKRPGIYKRSENWSGRRPRGRDIEHVRTRGGCESTKRVVVHLSDSE